MVQGSTAQGGAQEPSYWKHFKGLKKKNQARDRPGFLVTPPTVGRDQGNSSLRKGRWKLRNDERGGYRVSGGSAPSVVKERLSRRQTVSTTIEYKEEANGVIAPGRGRGSQVLRVLCNAQEAGQSHVTPPWSWQGSRLLAPHSVCRN